MHGTRTKLFISHATPDDNEFSIWLASRLTLAGFDAWLDKRALLGGEDFWSEIEHTIRHEAAKVLVAITPVSITRPGVKKEIALAETVGRNEQIENFLIPMRAGPIDWGDFPVEFIRVNGIPFHGNWGKGLGQLLEVLERDETPRSPNPNQASIKHWKECQLIRSNTVQEKEEIVVSNRIEIRQFPPILHFYELRRPMQRSGEMQSIAKRLSIPCFAIHRLLASYASLDELQASLGPQIPLRNKYEVDTEEFLDGQNEILNVRRGEARKLMTSLIRKGIDRVLSSKGLISREMANGNLSWWFPEDLLPDNKFKFVDINGTSTWRAVVGKNKNRRWHLGFTAKPNISDARYVSLRPRVVVADSAGSLIEDDQRMNLARKRVCKRWFNNRWRGQVVGFADWLKEDNQNLKIPVSQHEDVVLAPTLMTFASPLSIIFNDTPISEQAEIAERLNDPAFKDFDDADDDEDN